MWELDVALCYLLLFSFVCGISKLCLHSENEKVIMAEMAVV